MANYSKLIGSIVGGVAGLLVMWGFAPEELATPEVTAAVTTLLAGLATYLAPANVPPAD